MLKEIANEDEFGCINCGDVSYYFVYNGFDRLHGVPGDFKILECVNCGLFTLRPRLLPEEVGAYYPDDYFSFVKAIDEEPGFIQYLNRLIAREKRVHQIVKRSHSPGRILDVGCATGIFLNGMQLRGWDCYGIEPDQGAVEYARKRFGLEVFHGYLEDAAFRHNFFDVVTLMDVIEHVIDPVSTLREIHRIIKPNGCLVGILPNGDAWARLLFGPYWGGWDVPRHYHIFTPSTIRQLLEAQGFGDVQVFSFTGRHGAFMISLTFWLDDWRGPAWLKKVIKFTLGSLPVRILMLPGFYLAEWFNKSAYFSFSAQKKWN